MQNKSSLIRSEKIALCLLLLLIALFSCKEDNKNFILKGKVINPRQSQPLSGASVDLSKQVVGGGTFNGSFNDAAIDITDATGDYRLEWPRENFAALKLDVSKFDYFPVQLDLPPADFSAGDEVTRNISLYPKATIRVNINHSIGVSEFDELKFSFTNAQFDCACCNSDMKIFTGEVDTTLECLIYGDTWIKYYQEITTNQSNSATIDSVWCPAFQITQIDLIY